MLKTKLQSQPVTRYTVFSRNSDFFQNSGEEEEEKKRAHLKKKKNFGGPNPLPYTDCLVIIKRKIFVK